MTLYAKIAQTATDIIEDQVKNLIQGMTTDEGVKDTLFWKWNDAKTEGKIRELKKREENKKWFDKLPKDPSLEDVQEKQKTKNSPAAAKPISESKKSSESCGKNLKPKNSRA